MLRVENLHASYGGIKALRGISLEVGDHELVAVLGPNGAGKSTLLKCISGLHHPSDGTMSFDGNRLSGVPHKVVESGIALVPEGRQILPGLTVLENLRVGAFTRKDRLGVKQDLNMVFELFPILGQRQTQLGGLLSGGEQQMLAVARGLMSRPKLMLLDEPSLGLAPIIVNQVFDILQKINHSGTAILIVEQNVYKALSIAERAYILSTGTIEKSGACSDLRHDDQLVHAYLGK